MILATENNFMEEIAIKREKTRLEQKSIDRNKTDENDSHTCGSLNFVNLRYQRVFKMT